MNLTNLNKSQVIEMMLRIEEIRDSVLEHRTVYERYVGKYAYLYKVQMRLNHILHTFGADYTLCAYCLNGLDHNLNDHELGVERQRVTNELNENIFEELNLDQGTLPL